MRSNEINKLMDNFRDTLHRKTTFTDPQIETIIGCLRMEIINLSTPEEPPASSVEELRKKSKAFDNFVVNEMAKTPANEKQVGGNHYKTAIQPWDFVLANNIGFLEGNAIKYIARHKQKNGIEDINKAIHYLEKLKEHEASRSKDKENTI